VVAGRPSEERTAVHHLRFSTLIGIIALVVFGGSCSDTPGTPTPTLVKIALSGAPTMTVNGYMMGLAIGQTGQILVKVTGTYSDGSTKDVTSRTTFTSNKPAVAIVSASGLVTGLGANEASIGVNVPGFVTTVLVSVH
jgi:hypothetical protein